MFTSIVLVIASSGYQPIEYDTPKRKLKDAGFEVVTVSDRLGTAISKDPSITTQVDCLVSDVSAEIYDGLFFIGGHGALEHLDNEISYTVLRKWKQSGKPYGAICVSPRILANAGVLNGKQATGWDGDGELAGIFERCGVEYLRKDVVVDGHVVTANGPRAAEGFGKKIIQVCS
ncbi:MAG: DJ-1/PfpI family protein [Candidatus Magasanikbacteria bacterium]|nr:DJ-1/PfpI family protein [Candidatus Magasanikbacteria bacterium]